jgi:hypothetical protein
MLQQAGSDIFHETNLLRKGMKGHMGDCLFQNSQNGRF